MGLGYEGGPGFLVGLTPKAGGSTPRWEERIVETRSKLFKTQWDAEDVGYPVRFQSHDSKQAEVIKVPRRNCSIQVPWH